MQAKQRNKLEAELHVQYGHHLYAAGDFEEAFAQLGMSSGSNAISLLHLFPSLASPALLHPMLHLAPGTLDRALNMVCFGLPCVAMLLLPLC